MRACEYVSTGVCARGHIHTLCAHTFTCVQMVRTWPVCAVHEGLRARTRIWHHKKTHHFVHDHVCAPTDVHSGTHCVLQPPLPVWAGHMIAKSRLTYIYHQHSICILFKQFTLNIVMIQDSDKLRLTICLCGRRRQMT